MGDVSRTRNRPSVDHGRDAHATLFQALPPWVVSVADGDFGGLGEVAFGDEVLEVAVGHGAGVEVAFGGPVAESGFGGEAEFFESHSGWAGGLDGFKDGAFGLEGVVARLGEESGDFG